MCLAGPLVRFSLAHEASSTQNTCSSNPPPPQKKNQHSLFHLSAFQHNSSTQTHCIEVEFSGLGRIEIILPEEGKGTKTQVNY